MTTKWLACVKMTAFAVMVCFGFSISSTYAGDAKPEAQSNRPIIKVMSPALMSYIVGASGESRVLIAIEITDAGGAGIVTDDTGEPRFVEADDNVEAFARYVVAKGNYTNNLGQTVIQLFSEVPIKQLKTSDEIKITPPLDVRGLDPADIKKGIPLPTEAAVDVAVFHFQVKDRHGVSSDTGKTDNDGSKLYLGFATSTFKPSPPPKSGSEQKPKDKADRGQGAGPRQ